MTNDNIEFACNRCGNCCNKMGYLTNLVSCNEWVNIAKFIKEEHNDVIEVKCNCGCGESKMVTSGDILSEFVSNNTPSLSSTFLAFDDAICPFLKVDENGKFYSCEIQHIKPKICLQYRCDS